MSKSARVIEKEIRKALKGLPPYSRATTAGLYQLMRFEYEDILQTAAASADDSTQLLPLTRHASLAGREAASASACLARLADAGLVNVKPEGIYLPHVLRIASIRMRDRGYKVGIPTESPEKVGIPTGVGSEMGSEFRLGFRPPPSPPVSPPPPPPSFPPITPLPTTPTTTPITPTPTAISPTGRNPDAEIYQAYPRKMKPQDAFRAIRKAYLIVAKRGDLDPWAFLLERTKAYAAARQPLHDADPDERKFTPYPASWFNAGGYDEDPEEWTVAHNQARASPKTARRSEIETFNAEIDEFFGACNDGPRISGVHEADQKLISGSHQGAGAAGGRNGGAHAVQPGSRRPQDPQAPTRLF